MWDWEYYWGYYYYYMYWMKEAIDPIIFSLELTALLAVFLLVWSWATKPKQDTWNG